ncbi:hypothetical protein [Citrobacter werkmanii]|uniref:hypothetical protein n=1 Tax=Citrobacter werkmanii TaxID=67827 RepID=UPI001D0B5D6C|nr:hypothetical protein [Citrobacter werkmanii]
MNLNKQEMRHALYQGKATRLIQLLAESTAFKKSTGSGVKADRMRDRYLVLRFVAFYLLIGGSLSDIEFRSDIDVFLASVMKFINTKADDEVINKAEKACLRGMMNVFQAVGTEAFRFSSTTGAKRRPINMGLFEVLVMVFSQIKLESLPENIDLHDFIEQYKKNFDDIGIFSGAIDTTEYVNMRFDFALEMIKRIRNAYTH